MCIRDRTALKLHDNLLVGGNGPLMATPARPGDEVRDNRRVERSALASDLSAKRRSE